MEECQEVVEGTNTTTTLLAEPSTAGEDPSVVLDFDQATSFVLLCLIRMNVLRAERAREHICILSIESGLFWFLFPQDSEIVDNRLQILGVDGHYCLFFLLYYMFKILSCQLDIIQKSE